MNWIKKVGNTFVRSWKFLSDGVIALSLRARRVVTQAAHIAISRLSGVDPVTTPVTPMAKGIGALFGLVVAACGTLLCARYVGLAGAVVVSLLAAAVCGLGIFGNVMALKVLSLVTVTNLVCVLVVFLAWALIRVKEQYGSIGLDDEEAPVVMGPMHS